MVHPKKRSLRELADLVLAALAIARVEGVGDGAHLRVLVVPCDPASPPPADRVRAALLHATGWLRSELAATVRRRRVPQLVFDYAPRMEGDP